MTAVHEDKLTNLRIAKGVVTPTWKSSETRSYHVQNFSEQDRTFVIDHVIRKEWKVVSPAEDPKSGPDIFRFKLAIAKGKTGSHVINEEKIHVEKGKSIRDIPETKLREYLAHAVPSAEVKAALTKALDLQTKITETTKKLAEANQSLKTIGDDQARLRDNLKIIPQSTDPYKRFLDKFVAQESEIEGLQKTIRETQATLTATQREYDVFIANLNAD